MAQENNHYYKTQNTLRLTEKDLDFIDEHYEVVAGTRKRMPIKALFLKAIDEAFSNLKPKEVLKEVSKQEDLDRITALEQELATQKEAYSELEEFANQLNATLEEKLKDTLAKTTPKEAIVLLFQPEFRRYIWAVLEISKKQKFANSYEELIYKVFEVVTARGELVLDQADQEYIKTLTYDLENETRSQDTTETTATDGAGETATGE